MKPFYGYYALPIFAILAVTSITVGILVAAFLQSAVGSLIVGFGCYLVTAYAISIHSAGQTRPSTLPKSIVEMLALGGDEQVLDVGCGLGKMSVAVAKLLRGGKVIGVDIWNRIEIPGNSPDRAIANAKVEGVHEKVEFRTGNALALPFPDNSFDLVTASSVLNNLHTDAEKTNCLREIYRVLRPSGKLLLWEPLRNLRGLLTFGPFGFLMLLPRLRWMELLSKTGFTDLEYSYTGMGAFLVRKALKT